MMAQKNRQQIEHTSGGWYQQLKPFALHFLEILYCEWPFNTRWWLVWAMCDVNGQVLLLMMPQLGSQPQQQHI